MRFDRCLAPAIGVGQSQMKKLKEIITSKKTNSDCLIAYYLTANIKPTCVSWWGRTLLRLVGGIMGWKEWWTINYGAILWANYLTNINVSFVHIVEQFRTYQFENSLVQNVHQFDVKWTEWKQEHPRCLRPSTVKQKVILGSDTDPC